MRISDWSSDVALPIFQRLQLADDFLRLHWSAPSSSSPFLSSGRLSTLTLSVKSDLWSLFLSLVFMTTSRGSENHGEASRFFMYVEFSPFESAMPSIVTAPPALFVKASFRVSMCHYF